MPEFDPDKQSPPFGPGGMRHPPDWFWPPRMRRRGPNGPRIFFAVFLIAAGTLLFLGNLGLLPIHNLWDLVPFGMIVLGLLRLLQCPRPGGRIFGGLLVAFGILFLLVNLGILQIHARDGSWPLSILFIIFGIGLLIKVLEPRGDDRFSRRWGRSSVGENANVLEEIAVFGSLKRKLDTGEFEGGEIRTFFGEVKIDLRRSGIALQQQPVTIDATAIFGAIKIRVPDTWRININGMGVLGAYEDKTIPPNQIAGAPLVNITGLSMFGSVEIEN
ncbi:MAG TPA: LiaF domain-containing protein [Bryobacteraceae bacterium]|jgi:predicted membrane protein